MDDYMQRDGANGDAEEVDVGRVHERHRAMLVDWLVELVDVFAMSDRTSFLAVAFVDRYLSISPTFTRENLQLLGATALHAAVQTGHEPVVRVLLEAGASPNVANSAGDTPLHTCESAELMAALIKAGGDANAANWVGEAGRGRRRRAGLWVWLRPVRPTHTPCTAAW